MTETALDILETTSTVGLMDEIQALKDGKTPVLSTFDGADRAGRIAVLQAMTDSKPLDDIMGKEFNLKNYVIQPIELANEETGELQEVPRIILVDDKGDAYHAVSAGIFTALKNLSSILGMPSSENDDWPIKVIPTREKTNKGFQVFTLKVIG